MSISDLTTLPLKAGAALRERRVFHPTGVLCAGTITRVARDGDGLPLMSGDVVGRISKGAGTPGSLPDFAGLAWRMQQDADARVPWDVLMVSSTARVVLLPAGSWAGAQYSTLMPLGYRGGVYWVRAHMASPIADDGLSVGAVRDRLASGVIEFAVEQARGGQRFTPLAMLRFDRALCGDEPECDQPFDPTQRSGAQVVLLPQWLTALRSSAYRNSRQGRGAE
ncbi:phosphodiesterase [Mycolicibacterium sp. 018/SC-01/001]|uniref:phosphodiesterase n=1 Tax=Mycolicibacterium sp. 018/SC-01/001 TaxID=2592069 RepID=UPI00117D00E8|nr:phosphodiesterase [Mycolicibacterium sp. 018/SC-01/001]TRW87783.1 phosphodiesterase [Mycolicibacterium sp. 018/SC-01/001]